VTSLTQTKVKPMKVRILKPTRKVKGFVGDIVDIDAETGNALACTSVVEIVEHDKVVINRLPATRRDYRPKSVKLAELNGEDVSGADLISKLEKPKKPKGNKVDNER